jgi:2',3'-cyclic-nucleotide 2'-phosphodiesterase (5'-nucleotidase family)
VRTPPVAHPAFRVAGCLVLAGLLLAGAACGRSGVVLLLTADAQGSVRGCESCSAAGGLGDISRRATLVGLLRQRRQGALLVDAGNFLVGPDSIGSGGRVAVAAYGALGYDAVNLSYRDFRLGKEATAALVQAARFPVISANLHDEASGRLLAAPFVVERAGDVRVAFVGLTELPAGVENLQHLRTQLSGVRVRPPLEALAEWLPKARAESDRVVLLFYGSAAGLDAVSRRFGNQLAAVLVGGLRPGDLPERTVPPTVATAERGTHVVRIDLPEAGPATVVQLPVDGRYQRDPRMLDVMRAFADSGSSPLR